MEKALCFKHIDPKIELEQKTKLLNWKDFFDKDNFKRWNIFVEKTLMFQP